MKNFDELIKEADGVMVARGDLAVNVGIEKVPLIQKELIKKARNFGKLSIVATQVLDSMVSKPYPTRAEVSDIANAILDGTDAIMLSNETAVGKYPLEAVKVIDRVAKEVEKAITYMPEELNLGSIEDAISKAVKEIAYSSKIPR